MKLVTFRLAAYETPLWAGADLSAGRYNRPGDGPTQYLSLHPMTPWAELLRYQDRRDRDRALMLRVPLWAVRVTLEVDPLEFMFDDAAGHGCEPSDLVSDDMTRCQELAHELRENGDGPRALIAPSAALPGTRNLILLDPAVAIGFEQRPVGAEDVPASMACQDGRCPDDLWSHVRYRDADEPHAALLAWEQEEEFEFVEPEALVSG